MRDSDDSVKEKISKEILDMNLKIATEGKKCSLKATYDSLGCCCKYVSRLITCLNYLQDG